MRLAVYCKTGLATSGGEPGSSQRLKLKAARGGICVPDAPGDCPRSGRSRGHGPWNNACMRLWRCAAGLPGCWWSAWTSGQTEVISGCHGGQATASSLAKLHLEQHLRLQEAKLHISSRLTLACGFGAGHASVGYMSAFSCATSGAVPPRYRQRTWTSGQPDVASECLGVQTAAGRLANLH